MKEYYYDDLEAISQTAREVWLAEQCSAFETEIQNLARDREKDHFVEELYRKLKQVTRRWQSWNHRSFGGVTSRGYVAELAAWERNVQLRGLLAPKSQSNSPEASVLQRFDEYCAKYEDLLQRFRKGIYQPLCDFFQNEKLVSQLNNIPRDLEKIQNQWNLLLTSGVIDDKLFSGASAEGNYPLGIRHRIHDFDLVLRLIPDLTEKAYEALRLARRWRLIGKTSAVQPEETYVVSRGQSRKKKRRGTSKVIQKVNTLEEVLERSKAQCLSLEKELEESNAKCEAIKKEVTLHRQRCNQLENELESVKKKCDSLREKLDKAKKENQSASNEKESSQEYCRVLQKELNTARLKYCTQKIKFINAKKRCAHLTNELETTREQLKQFESELEARKRGCQALQIKLENSKKNIFTQGNMLDVLQNQCFTLKEELDGTKVKCLELTCELEKSQEKCCTLEKELEFVRSQFLNLQTELRRAKTREELLVQQNTQLRKLFQEKGLEEPSVAKINLHAPDSGSS